MNKNLLKELEIDNKGKQNTTVIPNDKIDQIIYNKNEKNS